MARDQSLRASIGLPLPADDTGGEGGVRTEIQHLVTLGGEHEPRTPRQAGARDRHGVERELEALIAHRPDVLDPRGRFGRLRRLDLEQQVRRVLDVVLDATREPVVQETEIDRTVVLVRALPFEVRVGIAPQGDTRLRCISPRVRSARAPHEQGQGRIGRYAGVACAAPADAQPEVRERAVPQELLLTEVPRSGQPGENAPLVTFSEPGRSVIAQHAGHEKPILEAVVRPGEERDETPVLRPRGVGPCDGGVQLVVCERVGEEADPPSHDEVALELGILVAAHDVEAVHLPELPSEGEQALQRARRVLETRLLREPVTQRHPHGIR